MKIEELVKGDYYVYSKYGVCQYVKPEVIDNIGGSRQFYLFYYKNKRQCFLTEQQVGDALFFYADSSKEGVKLDNMDNKIWKRKKEKSLKEIKETSEKLVKLYTERQTLKGYAFNKDTKEQETFENAYPYELTDDQKKALKEIKLDLESNKPMNALLYGAVGSGKSTVMQCIAFKGCKSGYQVIILSPTELLAKQHYQEFTEVFKPYKDINIAFISGSITKKNKELIKVQIENGEIDILIGTTSILSQKYNFKNLGLVQIDEEQRYSVKQKELLKTVDPKVNQILCTGTAIPRTSYMCMSGIMHKISINSLPKNKKEPKIELSKHKDEKIAQFIKRELDRNGQVYYILNDTLGLYKIREYLLQLNEKYNIKKDLKIGIVNGKLKKKESNQIFDEFKNGKYDILIATTIVEIGLTCKNANSILVSECERFGLSSLIQLIGRTGRSGIQPYVLLTYGGELNPISKIRLEVVLQHTELNNGEIIAKEDLKLRGAGQIFGDSQHGHTAQIGMDMYNHLMEEEIKKQKEQIA